MNNTKLYKALTKNWYLTIIGLIILGELLVFGICGESSYIPIHDNLDLFVSHFKMLKDNNLFFAQEGMLPMLSGISRDAFASEFSLYNILYYIFPIFPAYMIGYFLSIFIGFFSMKLLLKSVYQETYSTYKPLIYLISFGYSIIPVFPAYRIAFTSIPLVVFLLQKIYKEPKLWHFIALFLYPLLSYFSYFGFFILGYMVVGFFILWIKDRKINKGFLCCIPLLSIGYVLFEYRLFRQMLLDPTITIRTTMVNAEFTLSEVISSVVSVFKETIFHAQDSHGLFILPMCILLFLVINAMYFIPSKKMTFSVLPYNLVLLFILFNCIIYGLYDYKPFRDLFEMLLPPLTGFQFNRTIYFNPFLWYVLFFLGMKFLYDCNHKIFKIIANIFATVSVFVVLLYPQVYNDFYHTCYNHVYEIVKGKESNGLNFQEFYSTALFDEIKSDINYQDEKSVAYGMHPAILHYNGISTLDGYLGLYSQEYKDEFREVITPALDKSDEFRTYFDDWGARAYIYSGSGENTYQPVKDLALSDTNLYMDSDAFKDLNGAYIFSRIEIANAAELNLQLYHVYTNEDSPYTIYLYTTM